MHKERPHSPSDKEVVISARGLTKRYGSDRPSLDGVDLTIHRGDVFGLLGSNGAGKTTFLSVLLGLTKPTSGSVTVLGNTPTTFSGPDGIGALVETPAFYPYLSGKVNLRLRAKLLRDGKSGRPTGRGVEEVLDLVGLSERADDRFRKYSLGMRQRLGIAAALLGEPELLLLDEPTNGLDPRGMSETRQLIRNLGSRGDVTIVLSSHLLGEIEQVCTRIGIINRGKLVHESGIEEALDRHRTVSIRAEPFEVVVEAAEQAGFFVKDASEAEGVVRLLTGEDDIPQLVELLVHANVRIKEVRLERRSLEQTYMELTREEPPK